MRAKAPKPPAGRRSHGGVSAETSASERWMAENAVTLLMRMTQWGERRARATLAAIDRHWARERALEHGGEETIRRLGRHGGVYVWHVPYTNIARVAAAAGVGFPPGHMEEDGVEALWSDAGSRSRAVKIDIGHRQRTAIGEIARAKRERDAVGRALRRAIGRGIEEVRRPRA